MQRRHYIGFSRLTDLRCNNRPASTGDALIFQLRLKWHPVNVMAERGRIGLFTSMHVRNKQFEATGQGFRPRNEPPQP